MRPRAAVVDYELGNLFSAWHACENAGFDAVITSSVPDILAADAVVLPGVGAFGDAMSTLRRLGLVAPLEKVAASGRPLVGVCLGMQLLMSESHEFGRHEGLGIIPGRVMRFDRPLSRVGEPLKIPHVGWNRICALRQRTGAGGPDSAGESNPWAGSPLEGLAEGEYMYFVHSYYVEPEEPSVVLATTRYGHIEFCSSLFTGNISGCQFHPERSGPQGLKIYRNLAARVGLSPRCGP
jgi:glutamine amidotransferase